MKHTLFVSVTALVLLGSVKEGLSDNSSAVKPASEWKSLNGYGFYISTEIKKWDDAQTFCETQNASFAQPTDEAQVLALASLLKDRKSIVFWVGANNRNTTFYSWLNGDEVTDGWRNKQPDSNKTGRCVLISYEGEHRSGLSVWHCSPGHTNRFICQIAQSPTTTITTGTETPAVATSNVIWYAAGGVLALVLLGLLVLSVICLKRRLGGTSSSGNAVRPTSQHQYSDPDEVIPPASHQGNAVRPSSQQHLYSDPDEVIPTAAHQGNITGSNIEAIYEDGDVLPTPVYPGNITYSNIGTSYEEPIVLPTPVYPGDSANNYLILQ